MDKINMINLNIWTPKDLGVTKIPSLRFLAQIEIKIIN